MVIFLDLDGVINCEADWAYPYTVRMMCVKSMAALVKELKADIVLTSSRRAGWVREGKCTLQREFKKYVWTA